MIFFDSSFVLGYIVYIIECGVLFVRLTGVYILFCGWNLWWVVCNWVWHLVVCFVKSKYKQYIVKNLWIIHICHLSQLYIKIIKYLYRIRFFQCIFNLSIQNVKSSFNNKFILLFIIWITKYPHQLNRPMWFCFCFCYLELD